jgi:hypothetical protein
LWLCCRCETQNGIEPFDRLVEQVMTRPAALPCSRVSLAPVIFAFREGASPETIRHDFPSLSLGQVYGAIAFYLNHPAESGTYLQRMAARWKELERQGQPLSGELQEKLEQARLRLLAEHR